MPVPIYDLKFLKTNNKKKIFYNDQKVLKFKKMHHKIIDFKYKIKNNKNFDKYK